MDDSNRTKSEHPAVASEPRGFWRELWDIVRVLLISLAIVVPLRYFVVQPFIVRGASMEPNFEDREYLLVDEMSYYFRAPERGEVIVFRYPRDPRQFFIKRIIGLPGETVAIKNGRVRIVNSEYPQGFVLEEQYLVPLERKTHPEMTVTLGQGEYFVMGDNRDASSDSRIWGVLGREYFVGRAFVRVWPFDRLGIVPREIP